MAGATSSTAPPPSDAGAGGEKGSLKTSASEPNLSESQTQSQSQKPRCLSPGAHMNRMRMVANRPMEVIMNTEFSRYYFQEEWQFPQSKSSMKSDYQHACDFLKRRWSKDRNVPKVMLLPTDMRDSKNVKTLFGNSKCGPGLEASLYIDSFYSDSAHRRALWKSRKMCGETGLSTTDVTKMAEQEGLMKNVIRK